MVLTNPKQKVYNFMDATTFHGLRYITDMSGRIIRRLLWFAVCGSSFGLFTFIVVTRVQTFYLFQKTVSIEIEYPVSMLFPAVTICNMNMLRSSVAINRGLYDSLKKDFKNLSSKMTQEADTGSTDTFHGYMNTSLDTTGHVEYELQTMVVNSITTEVCQQLCLQNQKFHCNSILYDTVRKRCTVMEALLTSKNVTMVYSMSTDLLERIRQESQPNIRCSFEANLCDFIQSTDSTARWQLANRQKGRPRYSGPENDHTSGKGQYLYMDDGDGKTAAIVSPLISAANRCVEFYYHMYGRNIGQLSVHFQNADRNKELLWEKRGNQGKRWHRALIRIPSSLFMLHLSANGSRFEEHYIAIDDLRVANCDDFEENCKRHEDGTDYMGNISKTISGKECLSWSEVAKINTTKLNKLHFPKGSLEQSVNYCRNPSPGEYNTPWCYVTREDSEECDIKFCECSKEEFTCHSKKCVPMERKCDGGNDCDDNSDEEDECNVSINCSFEDNFKCGYKVVTNLADYKWQLGMGNTKSYGTGPITDKTHESATGGYLYVDSTHGLEGDEAILTSPHTNITMPLCLTFAYHMFGDHVGQLDVLLTKNGKLVPRHKIYTLMPMNNSRANYDIWREASITVNHTAVLDNSHEPKFMIAFEAIRGTGTRGDIAIDDVKVEPGICIKHSKGCAAEEIQCRNGRCVKGKKCDGIDDCYDNSDEGEQCASLSCTFNDGSTCGYDLPPSSPETGSFNITERNDSTIMVTDGYTTETVIDQYHLSWSASKSGLMQKMKTGWEEIRGDGCATYIRQALGDQGGILRVYVESCVQESTNGRLRPCKTSLVHAYVRDMSDKWVLEQIPIKATMGRVRLIFEASAFYIGNNIAIDNINITDNPCDLTHENIACSFEDIRLCGYKIGMGNDFSWAREKSPGRGHVMRTDRRAIYGSNTTTLYSPAVTLEEDNCLKFDYKISGLRPGSFSVLLYQDSYVRQVWKALSHQTDGWQSVSLLVHAGETVVLFQAVRGYEDASDVQLDNVILQAGGCGQIECPGDRFQCENSLCVKKNVTCDGWDDCGDMSDEKECNHACLISPNGATYQGTLSMTENGISCRPWSQTVSSMPPTSYKGTPALIFPDHVEKRNYCRNPGGVRERPGCFIDETNWRYCDIETCACNDNQFTCGNGNCVPKAKMCDSVDDCGNNADEEQNCQPSLACEFYDVFKCGYRGSLDNWPYIWHQSADVLTDGTRNITSDGMYVYASSRTAETGRTARLNSRPQNVKRHSCLEVIYLLSNATSKNFKIFLKREGNIFNILDTITYQGFFWFTRYYDLSPGTYQLVFEAELNKDKTYIDKISLTEGKCEKDDVRRYKCYLSPAGLDYNRNVNTTKEGVCQRWNSSETKKSITTEKYNSVDWAHFATLFPEGNLTLAGANCRNPEREVLPYCYVDGKRVLCENVEIYNVSCPQAPEDTCNLTTSHECRNGRCVAKNKLCDGINACGDATDEIGRICNQTCLRTGKGEFYTGTKSVSRNGNTCLNWKDVEVVQKLDLIWPDTSLEDAKNFCRNPNGTEGGPWCFVGSGRMESCDIQMCNGFTKCDGKYEFTCNDGSCIKRTMTCDGLHHCPNGEDEDTPCKADRLKLASRTCRVTLTGVEYVGQVNTTKSGKDCVSWTGKDHNFCRNFKVGTDEPSRDEPWCYFGMEPDEWEVCDIPRCDCSMGRYDYPYIGNQNRTRTGLECLPWMAQARSRLELPEHKHTGSAASAENYCREADWTEPYCYTHLPTFAYGTCDVEVCPGGPEARGVSCEFESGFLCGYETESCSDFKRIATVSWVRRGVPNDKHKNIDELINTKMDICMRRSSRGGDYTGHLATTASGRTCQRWDSQFPHSFDQYGDEDFPGSETRTTAENYCRNPRLEIDEVWCYTTDPEKRWEVCNVSKCTDSVMSAMAALEVPGYADLITPYTNFESGFDACLKFELLLPGGEDPPSLMVLIENKTGLKKKIWTEMEKTGKVWKSHKIKLTKLDGEHRIIFRLRQGHGIENSALDSVSLKNGSCPEVKDCNENEFSCSNGRCIEKKHYCNGIDDCLDYSDELGDDCRCKEFKCGDGRCISNKLLLDKKEDCLDGSDENFEIASKHDSKTEEIRWPDETVKRDHDYVQFPPVNLSGSETYEFFKEAAHQKDDFIHRCLWNNKKCEETDIVTTVTDLGFCFTFNQNSTHNITNRGSNYGLKLILNVETYEYMEGIRSTAGVKAHLHEPESKPPISELGFALGPGFGYLVEVEVTKTTKLGKPWGKCQKHVNLKYFDKYDRTKCRMECATNQTIQSCECYAPHMPFNKGDDVQRCDFHKYTTCYLPLVYNNTDEAECICPEQCEEMTFSRQISFGTLGAQARDQILSGDTSQLSNRVAQAAAADALKDADAYVRDRSIFDRISELLLSLLQTVDGLWPRHSSRIEGADQTIDRIDEAVVLANRIYEDAYNKAHGDLETRKRTTFEDLSKYSALLRTLEQTAQEWDFKLDLLFEQSVPNATTSALGEQMRADFRTADLIFERFDKSKFPKGCLEKLNFGKSKQIAKQIGDLQSPLSREKENLKSMVNEFGNNVRGTLNCIDNHLERVETTMARLISLSPGNTVNKTRVEQEELRKSLYVRELRVPLVHIEKSYKRLLDRFMMGQLKKVELVDNITTNIIPPMKVNTITILSQINSLFLNPYSSYLSSAFAEMKVNYVEMVRILHELHDLFPEADLPQKLHSMNVWKRQLVVLEPSVKLSDRRQIPQEQINVYQNKSLREVEAIIDEYLAAYTEPIVHSLTNYRYGLIKKELELKNVTDTIRELAETSAKATQLDEDFVRKNFLTVDLFLAQLSKRLIDDREALSIPDLFGSIGGYMGLLIGGSILSVCEILDLIVALLLGPFWVKPAPLSDEEKNDFKERPKENHSYAPDDQNGVNHEKVQITTVK